MDAIFDLKYLLLMNCVFYLISHAADDDSGLGGGAGRAPDGEAAGAPLGLPGDRAQAPHRHRLQLQTGTRGIKMTQGWVDSLRLVVLWNLCFRLGDGIC